MTTDPQNPMGQQQGGQGTNPGGQMPAGGGQPQPPQTGQPVPPTQQPPQQAQPPMPPQAQPQQPMGAPMGQPMAGQPPMGQPQPGYYPPQQPMPGQPQMQQPQQPMGQPQQGYYPPQGGQQYAQPMQQPGMGAPMGQPQQGYYPPQGGQYGQPMGGGVPMGGQMGGAQPQDEDNTPANFQLGTKLPPVLKVKVPPHPLKFDEAYFLRLLAGSISLTKDEKKKIVESVPKLRQSQVDELIRIFEEEKRKFAALSKKHVPQLEKLAQQHYDDWMDLEKEVEAGERKNEEQAKAEEIRKNLGL